MVNFWPSSSDVDIIVIGAGLSGLTAAYHILLRDPNLSLIILEARGQIGGRIFTVPLFSGENYQKSLCELGGQFVQKSQVHLIDLLGKLDINLLKVEKCQGKSLQNCCGKVTTFRGNLMSAIGSKDIAEFEHFLALIEEMSENISFARPWALPYAHTLNKVTMEEFINENLGSCIARETFKNLIKTTIGSYASGMSVLFFLAFCNSTDGLGNIVKYDNEIETYVIEDGVNNLCEKIADFIGWHRIKTNEPVDFINRETDFVNIKTKYNMYRSDYVIIALPPKSIRHIYFEPKLPWQRLDVVKRMYGECIIKFVAIYNEAFWSKKGLSGNIISSGSLSNTGPFDLCISVVVNEQSSLVGYIFQSKTFVKKYKQNFYKDAVLNYLAEQLGEEAKTPAKYMEDCLTQQEFLSRCPMACPYGESMADLDMIRKPIGRLFWAGAETATLWYGFMAGAVQSGYRAALEVLYDCRPNAISLQDIVMLTPRRNVGKQYTSSSTERSFWAYQFNQKLYVIPFAIVAVSIFYTYKYFRK